ncbi:unnamed protein product [Caenorhabditis bovis]|uniref:Uncharacterized protein n=1 Tax=Caenorhabditis bovis TaxID=2654633 RepID=A0A8S1EDS8_9PELO|nr:unnamed protein product [Caenorhabditis bovis]
MAAKTQRFYGPSMKQSGALTQPAAAARGARTLGWFMADTDLFDKKQQQHQGGSDESNENSRRYAGVIGEEKKRQRRHHHHRKAMSAHGAQRKDGYAASQAMSESSEEGYEEKRLNTLLADLTLTHQKAPIPGNEEYWFYDVASDGYYYEQNGAKGWRRRMPNGVAPKNEKACASCGVSLSISFRVFQEMMSKANNVLAAQARTALIQQILMQQQQAQNQPSLRYYDPNSDGFYYEMASVDGWKRRQPNKPVSASVPAGITRPYAMRQAEQQQQAAAAAQTSSYGAALARGQMPRNCVIDESSASSSISGDHALHDLLGAYDYPSISRPSTLNFEKKADQMNPNFNADRFINDLSFSGLAPSTSKMFSSPTPSSNNWTWSRGCNLWNASPAKSTTAVEDEANMTHLLKDLEKIWAAPTPVSSLNA